MWALDCGGKTSECTGAGAGGVGRRSEIKRTGPPSPCAVRGDPHRRDERTIVVVVAVIGSRTEVQDGSGGDNLMRGDDCRGDITGTI